jgi:hypothetical protein
MKCSTSTIGRFIAMAPRVANITESTVAISISARMPTPPAIAVDAMVRMRSIQPRWSSTVTAAIFAASAARSAARSGRRPGSTRSTMMRGTGSASSASELPSHGSSRRADSSAV